MTVRMEGDARPAKPESPEPGRAHGCVGYGANAEALYDRKVRNRLKRVEGQIRGVLRMMEERRSCAEVIYQLSAARTALDRAILYLVGNYMEQCMRGDLERGETIDGSVEEAIRLLLKTR
ncbi:DNA-binding FrmR family transcriptional regulator [Brockia lithotrophica]|uniref:DNA-binding FrmR family transcriptional regulator n=1 Tax=Brockia lithotrophica TaxID=933949 RepID=A0A660L046_9BACL|nr:DNA-binding FrmR family transcriptional regulator [Brockia lithotrophica]